MNGEDNYSYENQIDIIEDNVNVTKTSDIKEFFILIGGIVLLIFTILFLSDLAMRFFLDKMTYETQTKIESFLTLDALPERTYSENEQIWLNRLNNINNNIIPAIGGIDAHALKIPGYILPVTVFPYKSMFKTITNVITLKEPLSGDFQTAKSQVLNAIKSGNNFVINRKVSKNIPVFKIKNKTGEAHSGESIELDNNTILTVKAAPKSSIKVFHNGEEIIHNISDKLKIILDRAGKYRVEIKIGNKGFAYSNPVLVY